MKYFKNILIAVTQLLNALLGGYPDESTSSRAHRLRRENLAWDIVRRIVNLIFFWEANHCRQAYISEMTYRQIPPEFRK